VTAKFTDEKGKLVPPNTVRWTLIDVKENIINGREQVEIASPSSEEDIVLSGDDLQITEDEREESRFIIFEGDYDSDLGSGLPITEEARFVIANLKYIS
ncbi:MAG: hypothetical protein V5A79_06600, partial [Candidatus Bipolaricaulota bacterium]